MPSALERGGQPYPDEFRQFIGVDELGTENQDIGVVVFPGQTRRFGIIAKGMDIGRW